MSGDRPVVLVTGANGFVGRHLVPMLARDGWGVRRAVRRPVNNGQDTVIESIGAATDWSVALAGVKAVVHLAARVHHPNDPSEVYRSINTEGTLRLARCAQDAGVQEFVFVSTVLVHGRSNDGRTAFSERDILTPRGMYGMSKAAAEAGLESLAQAGNMRVTVVRPPLVYGPGAKGNFALLARAIKLGIPLPFGGIDNSRAFVSVENLASFILWRLAHPGAKFDTFLIADTEQVSTPEFIRRLARAAHARPRLFSLPTSILGALLKVSGRAEAYDSLMGSLELDISKAIAAGWRPSVTLDEGLQHALTTPET